MSYYSSLVLPHCICISILLHSRLPVNAFNSSNSFSRSLWLPSAKISIRFSFLLLISYLYSFTIFIHCATIWSVNFPAKEPSPIPVNKSLNSTLHKTLFPFTNLINYVWLLYNAIDIENHLCNYDVLDSYLICSLCQLYTPLPFFINSIRELFILQADLHKETDILPLLW